MRSSIRHGGAVRFDVMVSVVLIFVLLGVLLDRLDEVQRESERTVVDMEVAALRAELQINIASHMARGEEAQLLGWEGRNPAQLAWGGTRAVPASGDASLNAQWRWDARAGTLSYTYRDGKCLKLRLARAKPGQADGWSLGSGLLLVPLRKEKSC